MDNPKTVLSHNASLTGSVEIRIVPAALIDLDTSRRKISEFKSQNPDIHLSDAQWTKLIDFLTHG